MTVTNSPNDRLILRQNVEINSNEYLSCGPTKYFSGNEIVDHVDWKRYCTIGKTNVSEFRFFSTIYYGFRTINCAILHLFSLFVTIDQSIMSFSLKKKNFCVITEAQFFLVRCVVVPVEVAQIRARH